MSQAFAPFYAAAYAAASQWGRGQLRPLAACERPATANNITAIRLAAALAVVFAHAWPIALGHGALDPITRGLVAVFGAGVGLSTLAVGAFFVVSGYLVAKSAFARTGDLFGFAQARALRLFPALLVNVALTVFLLGPVLSQHSVVAYFDHHQVWKFFFNNALMWNAVYVLPGVFTDNPLAAVNGSLWTLPIELRCYAVVGLFAALTLFRRPGLLTAVILVVLGAEAVFADANLLGEPAEALNAKFFLLGVLAFLHRSRAPASLGLAAGLLALAWVAPWEGFAANAGIVGFTLLVLWAGLVAPQAPSLERWIGDPSYGIYIYAFPLQQICVQLFGAGDPWIAVWLAGPLAFAAGVASWRYIEAPALALKDRRPNFARLSVVASVSPALTRTLAPLNRFLRR